MRKSMCKTARKMTRILSLFTALCLLFATSITSQGAEKKTYTYTVTFSAGNQGTLSTADGVSISVDGGGDYQITPSADGKTVKITGLTAANSIRFLNSAVSLPTDSKYYVKGIRMGGRDDSLELAYFPVERDQDYVVAYGIQGDMVQYTVNYQDGAGNQLYPSQTYYGNVGDRPVIAYLYVEGFQPQAYNLTRTLQSDASKNVFTFVYNRIVTTYPVPGGTTEGGTTPEGTAPGAGQVVPEGATPPGGAVAPGGAAAPAGPVEPVGDEVEPEDLGENDTPLGENDPGQPEEIVDLDEEETPLGNLETEGTVAAANSKSWKNTWIALGVSLVALLAVGTGACLYWRMRKTAVAKRQDSEEKD